MSEITPNTPNPVREDAYKTELATKLGIDPQYIPESPVWRNEEEIAALAEMFANMSGGGGSGGGALRVNMTYEGSDVVLDKTWEEIVEAIDGGVLPYVYAGTDGSLGSIFYINQYEDTGSGYNVSIKENDGTSTIFTASSKTGYPTHSDGGGV